MRALLSTQLAGSEHNLTVLVGRGYRATGAPCCTAAPLNPATDARTLVRANMFEPLDVHALMQGLHVNDVAWLAAGEGRRVPPQEASKRRELVQQFVFWLFEEFLLPLLRVGPSPLAASAFSPPVLVLHHRGRRHALRDGVLRSRQLDTRHRAAPAQARARDPGAAACGEQRPRAKPADRRPKRTRPSAAHWACLSSA